MKRHKAKRGVCGVCGRAVVCKGDADVSDRQTRIRCAEHADIIGDWDWDVIRDEAGVQSRDEGKGEP